MGHANGHWPFSDLPNTAVITNVRILDREDWVQYVTHDEEEGASQFHPPGGQASMKVAAVTSRQRMFTLAPRIEELADLPLGRRAWRDDEDGLWTREHLPRFHSLMDECASAAQQSGNIDCLEIVDEVVGMLKLWDEYLGFRKDMISKAHE